MKYNKMFLLVIMLLPWLSVPFLGKRTFKRFYPGALFIGALIIVESSIAKRRVWWRFYEKLIPHIIGEMPLLIGPFFVGSLWILKFTFGKFFRYLFLNIVTDSLFVYPGALILKKWGIVSLVRMRNYQLLLLCLAKSVLMYGVQSLTEKIRRKPKSLIQRLFS